MTDKNPPKPPTPPVPETDLTVDLTLEDYGEGQDLQAFADDLAGEMAEGQPSGQEASRAKAMSREELESELARAQTRVEALEKLDAEHKDKHHRLMADFANHRNRVGRETQLAVTLAERKLLGEFLSVMDSLDRCVSATYNSVDDFHAGAVLIHKQLLEALRKAGVEPVQLEVGDPFDAQHAEALTTTSQKDLPDGSVAAIYERGYMLKDQLLRPARVIVNDNSAE
jgi:molecular chaperone GrpE